MTGLPSGPRIAALVLTDSTLRVVGTRVIAGVVFIERVETGVRARVEPTVEGTGEAIRVLRWIDEPSIPIDGEHVDTGEVLRAVFAAGLRAAGIDDAPDILVIVRPSHWGTPRCRRLEQAGREVAEEVVLLDMAPLAVEVADAMIPEGPLASVRPFAESTIVVSVARDEWVVTAVSADTDGYRSTADRLVRTDRAARSCAPEVDIAGTPDVDTLVEAIDQLFGPEADPIDCVRRVVLFGCGDPSVPVDQVARAIVVPRDRPWAEPLMTRVVSADAIAEAAYDRIARSLVPAAPLRQPAAPPPTWLGRDDLRPSRAPGASRRWLPGVAAAAVLLAVAAIVGWSGRGTNGPPFTGGAEATVARQDQVVDGSPVPTFLPTALPTAATTPDPSNTLEVADEGHPSEIVPSTAEQPDAMDTIELGRVTVSIPERWQVQGASDRIELVPEDAEAGRRILVQSVSVLPDTDVGLLERRLREQSGGPELGSGSSFEEFTVLDHDALSYLERPIDASVVWWRVFLRSELQISVGCQAVAGGTGDDLPADLARACDHVVASMTVRDP